jgi:pimeloyl-ACP methyl ester carboxylesterase
MGARPCRIRWHIPLSALFCLLIGGQVHAQVGPNGQIDGLTAKFVDINGARTRYYDYGRGEPIVLAHGGTVLGDAQTNANTWSKNIPGLAKSFRVLALDRLAQGMTGNPNADEEFGIEGDVEHLYQFIRTMKLDRVHLVGHSSSGPRVFYLALKHPQIVKSVTWIGVGGGWRTTPSRSNAIRAKCGDPKSDDFRKCWRAAVYPPDAFSADYVKAEDWIANLPKSVDTRRRAAAMLAISPKREADERARYRDIIAEKLRVGALQVPVLLYMGKQDLWDWDVDAPHAMLQGALTFFDMAGAKNVRVKYIVLNRAGHFVYREQPEQFNGDLIQFIEYWNNRLKP